MTEETKRLEALIDKRRALAAQLAGVDLEIAMHQGDREAAQRFLQEMNTQTALRIAARQAKED